MYVQYLAGIEWITSAAGYYRGDQPSTLPFFQKKLALNK